MKGKLFLGYCTLLAVFINLSGFVSAQKPVDFLWQTAFLPITLLLFFSLLKKDYHPPKINKSMAAVITIIFLLFLIISLRKTISSFKKDVSYTKESISNQPITPTLIPSPTPALPETITVYNENSAVPVNVREEPNVDSPVLAKLKPGAVAPCTDRRENWFQIKLKSEKMGWIFGDYVSFDLKEE